MSRGHRRREGRARGRRTGPGAPRRAGPAARSCSSTRSTASAAPSRTRCSRTSRTGLLVLIGATTENPFFSLTGPLLSRSTLFRLESLDRRRAARLCRSARSPTRRAGSATSTSTSTTTRSTHLADRAEGDARHALTSLDVAAALAAEAGRTSITLADTRGRARAACAPLRRRRALRRALGVHQEHPRLRRRRRALLARADGHAGEDPRFIARRLVILASEDVGMADPNGLVVADAAARAVEFVGMPEAQLNLAHAVDLPGHRAQVELGRSPRSAPPCRTCATGRPGAVPAHLRDAHYPGAAELGHGEGYVYPHDEPDGWVEQQYRPTDRGGAVLACRPGAGGDVDRRPADAARRAASRG